jgi:DNA-binding IclR family transcriptional regulator
MTEDSSRKTVDKAMRVLHAFSSERTELSVGELSAALGMHKSVVSRLVSSLRDWRMLEKDAMTQRIRIGAGAFRLGTLYTRENHLIRVAQAKLESLVQQTGQSAHLTVLDGDRVLVVATVDSPSALRVIMRLGDYRNLHATASGKLFLALSAPTLLDNLFAQGELTRSTPHTLTQRDELDKALARIRREGMAWNRGENTVGAGAVAAPIFDAHGDMVAALSVVYPLNVVNAQTSKTIAELTQATAPLISTELGFNG